MSLYICMDIGSTDLKYGLIDEAGRILLKQSRPSEAGQGGPRLMEVVKEAAAEMISRAVQRPEGICLSTSGMVDCEKGSILYAYAGQIPEYTGMPVKSIMEEAFHIPCEIENDVKCAALGEYYQGEAAGDCFMMTIGTGIGGCYIRRGEVVHGAGASAGEVGYMEVNGRRFQDLASASALCRRVAERKGISSITGYEVFDQAKEGDAICLEEIDALCEALASGIAILCYVLNPDRIVLGGGIMAQERMLRPRIERVLAQKLLPVVYGSTRLCFAKTKNDAGMIGAFYHVQNQRRKE